MEGKMAGEEAAVQNQNAATSKDVCDDLERILSVVVNRRKTYPKKCMELNKRRVHFELLRLENAKVITEDNNDKDIKRIIQELKYQKPFHFTTDDLNEVKQKVEKCQKKNEEINNYLEKRKMYKLNY